MIRLDSSRPSFVIPFALAAMMATSLGCSSADEPAEEPEVTPTELPDTLSGIVYDENDDIVEGVTVCVLDRDDIPCVTTDDMGQYALGLPHDEDVVLSYAKEGHVPKLRMYRSASDAFKFTAFQRKAYFQAQFDLVGVAWDETKAIITPHSDSDVVITLDPSAGDGPYYMNDALDLDTTLEAMADVGVAAYGNVEPGRYAVRGMGANDESVTCVPQAWSLADGAADVIARAGHITWVGLDCK